MRKQPVATNDLLACMVLDMSGSMGGVTIPVREGVNDYIRELKEDAQESKTKTLFSLTAFDTIFEHWVVGDDVQNVSPELMQNYVPRGGTALYDAIAHSLQDTDKKLAELGQQDMRVLHVTVTDGGENASQDFALRENGQARLARLIGHYEFLSTDERTKLTEPEKDEVVAQRKEAEAEGDDDARKGTWTFVYLGAAGYHGTVAAAQASSASAGYTPENAIMYSNTSSGVAASMSSLAGMTRSRKYDEKASTSSVFADAGQSVADYADAADLSGTVAPPTYTGVKPVQPGDVAEETGLKIEKRDLSDLLGGSGS